MDIEIIEADDVIGRLDSMGDNACKHQASLIRTSMHSHGSMDGEEWIMPELLSSTNQYPRVLGFR
jgi:lantibiotic modifying enzyme